MDTPMKLKDNTETTDMRLDRCVQFDARSRNFPMRALTEGKPLKSYTWRCYPRLDQGPDGACVGFAVSHELSARASEVKGLDAMFAKQKIYWEAQKIDPWAGGSYPGASPFYEGTSVLAGVKVAHKLGYMKAYRWAFGLEDLLLGIGYNGPAVMGINWYTGMFYPDNNGQIKVEGSIAGGHAILANKVDVKNKRVWLHNSWGPNWGINGCAWLTFDDMERLLYEYGEACFFLNRTIYPKPL